MKCSKCGCEFEGNFCPNCGTVANKAARCPICGKERAQNDRFCSGCGYEYDKAEQKKKTVAPETLYKVLTYTPLALFAAMAVLAFLFSIAPAVSGWFNVSAYGLLSNDSIAGMQGTAIFLLIAEVLFLVAAAALAFLLYRFKSAGDNRFLNVLKYSVFVSATYYLILLIIGIVMCALIAAYDKGFGAFSAGACPILFIIFSILFGIAEAASVALNRQFEKKHPQIKEDMPIISSSAASGAATATVKKERAPLSAKNKKIIIISSVLSAVLIIAVIAIVLVVNSLSNIFRIGKVSQIDLGDSKSQVVAVLGEPDEYSETAYTYYSDNYNKILKKIYNIESEDIDDWDDLAEATERAAELYEKLIALEYQRIDVTFSDGAVTAVYFDASCCDSTASDKTLESVTVLSGSFAQYSTDTTTQIAYKAEFTDGSYAKATATASRDSSDSITSTSKKIEINWSDSWHKNYSGSISVSESGTYYLDGNTLYIYSDNADYSTLTSREKSSITKIIIYDGVTKITDTSFKGFSSLTSITIPDSVTTISSSAFYDCTSLKSINIPDSVTSIGNSAFSGCTSLTSVTIPNGVTYIGKSAFYDCTSLTSITIPKTVTYINDSVFKGCTSLTNISLPDSITSIGNSAFYKCTSLQSIIIPDGVTSIEDTAFYGCTSLKSVTIGSGVTYIGNLAFYKCTALTSVTFENAKGWYVSSSSTATSGTNISSINLSDASAASAYLTQTYYDYYWHKK